MKQLKILYIFACIFASSHFCLAMEGDSSSSDEEKSAILNTKNPSQAPPNKSNLSDVSHRPCRGRHATPHGIPSQKISSKDSSEVRTQNPNYTFNILLSIRVGSLSSGSSDTASSSVDSSDTDFSSDTDSSYDNLPSYNDFLEMESHYLSLGSIAEEGESNHPPKRKKRSKSVKSDRGKSFRQKQNPTSPVPPLHLENLHGSSSTQSCFRLPALGGDMQKKSPPRHPSSPRSSFPNITGFFKKIESPQSSDEGESKGTSKKSPRSPKTFFSQLFHKEKGSSIYESEKNLKLQRKKSADQTKSPENRIKFFQSRKSKSLGDLPVGKPNKNLESGESPKSQRLGMPMPRKLSIEIVDEKRKFPTAKADHKWANLFNAHKPLKRKKMPPPEMGTQGGILGDCEGKGKEKEDNQYSSKKDNDSSLNEAKAEYKKRKFGIP